MTEKLVLQCLLAIAIASLVWIAVLVWLFFKRDSRSTRPTKAPPLWESRLAELQADVVSLSSSFEKVTKAVTRQNSRAAMRERREGDAQDSAPPPGASKAAIRKHYGLTRDGPEFARRQLALVERVHEE